MRAIGILRLLQRIWSPRRRYFGLQLMTVGFLLVPVGGTVSFAGSFIRHLSWAYFSPLVGVPITYIGWVIAVIGVVIMVVGLVSHWMYMFRAGNPGSE